MATKGKVKKYFMGLAGRADYIEAVSSRWSLYYFVEETIGFVKQCEVRIRGDVNRIAD
ncbi:hypothetical protein J4426_03080 [Candidatus Woesearchaeota archaeon]|nr:hypothetical protein [Candidatus Woesearchaeota archaeon]